MTTTELSIGFSQVKPARDAAATERASSRSFSWWGLAVAWVVALGLPLSASSDPVASSSAPVGPSTQAECLTCHTERDAARVGEWRSGPHTGLACLDCHGASHGELPAARSDTICTQCHGDEVAHSYLTSKHGVLVRLERPTWQKPLERGNYRAPGCSYCHLHAGDHGDSMDGARGRALREWVCGGCHAPRFVADQFKAGEELLNIGRLKAHEAEAIARRHPHGTDAVADLLQDVQRHLRNLRLGAGHQSPDYQWWHGQPALDGDLIRLREAVEHERRAGMAANGK